MHLFQFSSKFIKTKGLIAFVLHILEGCYSCQNAIGWLLLWSIFNVQNLRPVIYGISPIQATLLPTAAVAFVQLASV